MPGREASWSNFDGEQSLMVGEKFQDFATFTTDAEGRIRSWSPAAERLLGYCEEEIIGQSADLFFMPEDIQRGVPHHELQASVACVCASEGHWQIRKDGSRFWNSGLTTPLRDDEGNLCGFTRIMRDRTDWKRSDDAFKDALQYAQGIIETVREPLVILDGELRIQTANRSFYRTFQVNEDETQGHLLYDLGNRQWDIPQLRKLLEKILPQSSSFDDYEVTHQFPLLGHKVMLLNARRIKREGSPSELILLAIEDITQRRRLEEQREELETRFTSLVKNIRDHSIFTLDVQGHITSWNCEAERILGFSESEVIGQHFSLIFTAEDRDNGIPEMELSTAKSEGRADDERWHIRKSGELFWALGIVTTTRDSHGKHTGYSKILRDMTDRKLAEQALQWADRHKDDFLATLAHELRNPLAPLRNGLQLLMLTSDSDQTERTHSMMDRQLVQMARLVDDLMDVSRIIRNKMEFRKEQIELRSIVQCAIETAGPQMEANGHTFTVTLPPQPVYLFGDLTRLSQVIWNLLNNSAKYTESGGNIALIAETNGDEAIVTVRDNGIGIAAESLPGLFGMFSQVDRSLERAEGGLGIGLALVKGLTQGHGGTVDVQSDGLGCGSTFTVRLPVLKNPVVSNECTGREPEPSPKRKILVVDDNRDAASSLAMLLRVMGNETRTADDGLQAVNLADEFRPDVIVMDIGLPKLNGYDACRRIRQALWGKDVVIVAATGWNQEEDRRRSKEAGFDHHLVKPIDTAELNHLIIA
jgi:PAS domain S-box-containing protein